MILSLRLSLVAAALLAAPALAQKSADATIGLSDLPVPRFVSLAAGEVNMRAGPGDRYPVLWVYRRAGLPVEIRREYGIWRLIRDPAGGEGWVNKGLLSGARTAYVAGRVRTLHARPDVASNPVWRAEPGVIAELLLCEDRWCRLRVGRRTGYLLREQLWGVYPTEVVD